MPIINQGKGIMLQENALFPFHPFSYCVFVHCMPSPTALNFTIHLLHLFFYKGSTVSLSASSAFLNLLRKDLGHSKPAILPLCSAQTRTRIGHLRRPPGVELIPCRCKAHPTRPGANAGMKRTSVVGHKLYFARLAIVG